MTKNKLYKQRLSVFFIVMLFLAISATNSFAQDVSLEKKTLWISPLSNDINWQLLEDYTSAVTDAENNYPEMLKLTKVFKFYMSAMALCSDEELIQLANFIDDNNLEVAVEVGGIRMAAGKVDNDKIGIEAATSEYNAIKRFIDAGGKLDYITTDHSMAMLLTGQYKTHPWFTEEERVKIATLSTDDIYTQMTMYFKYFKERVPEIKFGTIESLGYFWVNRNGKQYQATDGSIDRLDFNNFIDAYLNKMQSAGLELDHFHIDFNLCPIEYIDHDYGRILEVEDYLESKNIDCGFIATNAFHESDNIWAEADNPVAAGISSAERSDKFFSQYVLAGGNADYLILQRWQPYPIELGDENSPYTQFGIMAAVVNSPYYEYGLGIDNTAKASIDINVYPNPVSDILNIESKSEIFGVSFYTIEGQRINIEKYYSGNTLKFDISNLEKGIYIIVISSEKGVVSKRLLKK